MEPAMRNAVLWVLFFLICFGLGYPTLNRYDPRVSVDNAADHADSVIGKEVDLRDHILVPYLAKPFYWMAKGRVGSWDPALFGLLAANAIFTATTALILAHIGQIVTGNFKTALLGALLFLLNFDIANGQLAGLVDSSECCFLLAVVATLLSRRWAWLPLWGALGALSKETFVVSSFAMALGWWGALCRKDGFKPAQAFFVAALGAVSLATFSATIYITSRTSLGAFASWALDPAAAEGFFLASLRRSIFNHSNFYVFAWLLPLGLVRLRELPKPWVGALVSGTLAVLAMGAYHDAGDSAARALFHVAGPGLSLSTAIFLAGRAKP